MVYDTKKELDALNTSSDMMKSSHYALIRHWCRSLMEIVGGVPIDDSRRNVRNCSMIASRMDVWAKMDVKKSATNDSFRGAFSTGFTSIASDGNESGLADPARILYVIYACSCEL